MLAQHPTHRIGVDIDPAMRHAIAGQEDAAQHRRRRAGADHGHNRVTVAHRPYR